MPEIVTSTWWNSRLSRALHLLFAIPALLLLFRLALEEDLHWVGAVLFFFLIVGLTTIRWPFGALSVLIGMSAMPVFFVQIAGWKARPEHFAAIIVFSAACLAFLFTRRPVAFDKLDYWIFAYLAANFLSSAVGSSDPASTLRWALQNSLAILPYFLIRFLIRDFAVFQRAFPILLITGLVESLYGIGCYLSHQIFGTAAGMSIGQYFVDVAAPYGSMYEPNIFGGYTGCCAVLFLACYLFAGRRIIYAVCFFVASLAAVLSFSRAAILALLVISAWLLWKGRRAHKIDPKKIAMLVLVLALIFALASTGVGSVMRERFTNLYYEGLTEETTISRYIIIQEALQEIPGHLLLGSGTASFNLSFDWGKYMPQWSGEKTWIGNAPLRIVHDTGLIGLATLLGFFASVAWRIRRNWKHTAALDRWSTGLLAGAMLYGICFQSTDGSILAFFWVHLGFLAAAVICRKNETLSSPDVTGTISN